MTCLNAAIRPANIRGVPEDTLYIPIIFENTDWNNPNNPFAIDNYTNNYSHILELKGIMKDTKAWKIEHHCVQHTGQTIMAV